LVIQDTSTEEDLEIEVPPIESFYWYFTSDELIEVENRQKIRFEVDTVKWVPGSPNEAYRWYHLSPNAAPIRAKVGMLHLCRVNNKPYEKTNKFLNDEPKPDDWLYTELIDASDRIELETDFDGFVLEGPISAEFYVSVSRTFHESAKEVGTIYHGMMSPEEIKLLSGDRVIRHAEVFETARQSKTALPEIPAPIHGGVSDLRLGSHGRNACYTCGHTANIENNKDYSCPGHFGRINLAVPVPNYLYITGSIDSSPLVKTLKYTCRNCHKIVLPDEYLQPLINQAKKIMYENKMTSPEGSAIIWKNLSDTYAHYYKEAKLPSRWGPYQVKVGGGPTPLSTKVNHCPHCNEKSPILRFRMKFGMGRPAEFFPQPGKRDKSEFPRNPPYRYAVVCESLEQIPNDHALAMSFNTEIDPVTGTPRSHPGYLFWRYLPIAPNTIRPPQETPGGGIEPNDLDKLYINVVKANQKLLDMVDDASKFARSESMLFKACTQALTSQSPFGTPALSLRFGANGTVSKALEGVYDRIKPAGEKKNHIRRINQSKVTEHTMYSVITPNTALRIDEVGVPRGACIRMTVAETVTKENIEDLREAVIKGHPPEKKGIVPLDEWDFEKYFGGAKYIQKMGRKTLFSLVQEENSGTYDPFAIDDSGGQKFPDEQTVWYREIRSGIAAGYRGVEDKTNMYLELKRAKREYKYEFGRGKRMIFADSLKVGDVVHRSLRKHDIILFTRAPALHRQNVMAGKIVPLKQYAFSFNPTICVPFNADYDGDTMRCFVPQSEEAIQEAKDILDVNKQIIHSRYGRPTIASDQDETSGAYLLTFANKSKLSYKGKDEDGNDITITYNTYQKLDDDKKKKFKGPYGTFDGKIGYDKDGYVYFTKKALIQMMGLVYTRDDEGNLKYMDTLPEPDFGEYYTGKAVVSHFIPEGINCDWEDSTKQPVSIRDGKLLYGTLDGRGVKNGSMVLAAAFIYHFNYELGIRKLADFIDHINRLFFAAHLYVGYTIGIEDISFESNVAYRHKETGEVISVGAHEVLVREGKAAGFEQHNETKEKIQELYDTASEKIRIVTEAFFTKTIEDLPDKYFTERSRHWVTYDPHGWMELMVGDITNEFDEKIIELTKELQGTANQMNIAVVSGARAGNLNIQQMSGAYGQVRVGGNRLMSGIKIGRLLPHFSGGQSVSGSYEQLADPEFEPVYTENAPDYSGTAFGFTPDSYSTGFSPRDYFLGSIAGRRSMMESSMGAIQKSGYLEHRLKRASENLMIDDRGYLVNTRLGKVLSLQVGEDGLQPFHARGPDNPSGLSLSLQSHFISQRCKHDIPLFDHCDTCQRGTSYTLRGKAGRLPQNILSKLTEKIHPEKEAREIEDPLSYFARAYEYYVESKARPGEMIGATGAANVGEPVTQAGLRAFHGGGKGTVPTTDRIVQVLDLSRSEIQQPLTQYFLKEEYNNEETAQKIANFCSSLNLDDIVKLYRYLPDERGIDIVYDQEVVETFDLDLSFIYKYLEYKGGNHKPIFTVNETNDGLRIRTNGVPAYIDIDSYLLVLKESLGKYQVNGLVNGGRGFAEFGAHPTGGPERWSVMIKGPEKPAPGRDNAMMSNADELIGEYIDEYLTTSNDPFWVAHQYGLEAALSSIKEIFNNQMNSKSGLGELDTRYIDALIDNMGSTGYLSGLGKSGHMVANSVSLIGGIGGEDPGMSLRVHPIMATVDRLEGMVEAVTVGKDLRIGKSYAERNSSTE
jgi:DNA-directed RNA polymerase beta' subunit